jgi:hypothetical protein
VTRGALAPALALAALLALAGCAGPALQTRAPRGLPGVPPPAASPAPAPAAVAPPAVATPDTVPSADALAVLAEIPEPIGSESRATGSTPRASAPAAPSAPADAGGGQADVPVPARTPVLGERPLPEVVAPTDTAAAPAAPAPAVLTAPPAAAVPDTCWRVQFAAWADRAKAERYLAAARSQLGVPLAIEKEAGLFKVRTSGCVDGAAADALRRRAREAGFDGAFRFRGGKP